MRKWWCVLSTLLLCRAATVERPVVRRETRGDAAEDHPPHGHGTATKAGSAPAAFSQPRGEPVHIKRIHPAEVEAWNFMEIDQHKHKPRALQSPSEDEAESEEEEEDQPEAPKGHQGADYDVEETEDPKDSDDLNPEDAEEENEDLDLAASLLSKKPDGESDAGHGKRTPDESNTLETPKGKVEEEEKKKLANATQVQAKKQSLPSVSGKSERQEPKTEKAHAKDEEMQASEDDSGTSESLDSERKGSPENTTVETGSDPKGMVSEKAARSNESRLADSQNVSFSNQDDTTEQRNASRSAAPEMARKKIAQNDSKSSQQLTDSKDDATENQDSTETAAHSHKNNTVNADVVEKELREVQDALRNAERRAAKAEADLQAEKAWVASALSGGEEALEPHQVSQQTRHDEELADLAQVLVNFENGRDAAKKLLGGQATNLRDDMDKAKDTENFDSSLDETMEEKDEKAWNKHRRMRRTYMKNEDREESDDGATEDEESDDVSSALEESSRQGPEIQKLRHKQKSHKHKKGGFHVYVEADGGVQ